MIRFMVLAVLLTTVPVFGQGKLVTTCADFIGHTYFLPGGAVSPLSSGWDIDSIKDGVYVLYDNDGIPSILFKDASGIWTDPEEYGATVQDVTGGASGHRLVIVNYAGRGRGTVELFLFDLDEEGYGTVLYSTVRSNDLVSNSRLLVGKCVGLDED